MERDKEVHGGGDCIVLFADGGERPVGRIQAVRACDPVSSGCRDINLEELMVVRYAANCVYRVAVGQEYVARVGCDVHNARVAKGRHGNLVPFKRAFNFFIRCEFIVIPQRAQHVQRVLQLRDHLAPQLDGTAGVHGGDVADDVVLHGLDCRLCCIGVVVTCRPQKCFWVSGQTGRKASYF